MAPKRFVAAAVAAASLCVPSIASADVVVDWNRTMVDAMYTAHTAPQLGTRVGAIVGRKPPRLMLPAAMARMAIPIGPLVGRILHQPPNLRELIRAADGVTYWATDAKARRELGYSPRELDTGLEQTVRPAR